MHYSSSREVFQVLFEKHESFAGAILIDFGCGPGTSGVAFSDLEQGDFHYIGIDIAPEMLKKADESIGLCGIPDRSRRFCEKFEELPAVIKETPDFLNSTVVILNFCFLLSPTTFKGDISQIYEAVKQTVSAFPCSDIYAVYQNPDDNYFHSNWEKLKELMEGFNSIPDMPKCVGYGRENPVYCDIITDVIML